jgi:hypothetical protein
MYRDTRLGEDVTPFVCGGLQAAILGFKSKFWAVSIESVKKRRELISFIAFY